MASLLRTQVGFRVIATLGGTTMMLVVLIIMWCTLSGPNPRNAAAAVSLPLAMAASGILQESGMTWADVGELAEALDAASYGRVCSGDPPVEVFLDGDVLTVTEVKLSDNSTAPPGRVLNAAEIESGLVLTREVLDVWVGEDLWMEARDKTLLVIGSEDVTGYDDDCYDDGGCSVNCKSGYYSCCVASSIQSTCTCIKNGNPPPSGGCTAGGTGSSSCSLGGS